MLDMQHTTDTSSVHVNVYAPIVHVTEEIPNVTGACYKSSKAIVLTVLAMSGVAGSHDWQLSWESWLPWPHFEGLQNASREEVLFEGDSVKSITSSVCEQGGVLEVQLTGEHIRFLSDVVTLLDVCLCARFLC